MALLSSPNFFGTRVQHVALSAAAHICTKLPPDASEFVMEAVPLLTNVLQYHDAKGLELALLCLTRIYEAFASSPDRLEELCNFDLLSQAVSLISTINSGGGQALLSTPAYRGLLRLLSTLASKSPTGAKTLLLLGISGVLKDVLSGDGLVASIYDCPTLSKAPEQIFEVVNLANELLPPLPQDIISIAARSSLFVQGSLYKESPISSTGEQHDMTGNATAISARVKLLNEQPQLLKKFGLDLLPILIQIYASSVKGPPVRHKSLSILGKFMYFSTPDMIQSLICATNLPSFLAGILACKDLQVLVPALHIAEILMERLPGTFSKMFVREGVVHAVNTLISTGSPNTVCAEAFSVETYGGSAKSNSNLCSAVSACAKAFKDKYFPTDVGVTDDLLHLRNLSLSVEDDVDHKTKAKGKSKAPGDHLPVAVEELPNHHVPEIPHDLVVKILVRLPVSSIIRFKVVCRSWASTFADPIFIKEQLKHGTHRLLMQDRLLPNFFCSAPLRSIFKVGTLVDAEKIRNPLWISGKISLGPRYVIIGTCNGVVCLLNQSSPGVDSDIFMWNPSTRVVRKLSLSSRNSLNLEPRYGFGFDELHDNYKIVRIGHIGNVGVVEVDVYSFKVNLWKPLSPPGFVGGYFAFHGGCLVGGWLNWIAKTSEGKFCIIGFDLGVEVFERTPLHPRIRQCNFYPPLLGVLSGSLCILQQSVSCLTDVWMMKEYGTQSSWTLLTMIKYPPGKPVASHPRLLHLFNNSMILLYSDRNNIVIYDIKEESFSCPAIQGVDCHSDPFVFVESLVELVVAGEIREC